MEFLKTWDRTSDLQESILNQFKVPKKKIQLGNLSKDHIAGTRTLSFEQILDPLTFLTEKAMAPHSSTLAWKILWMEEPGRLQSMGSLRVGHD